MATDFFSLKNKFEERTGLSYEEYTDFEKVWKKTRTYDGMGIVCPYDMECIARMFVEEGNITNADDALLVFYSFADKTTDKGSSCEKDGHYGSIILQDVDHFDSYPMRTLVKGKGVCNQIAAEILGFCKGVGIPAIFGKYKRTHGYVNAWTDTSGWVHVGYSEGILADPQSNIFRKFFERIIAETVKEGCQKNKQQLSEEINMVLYSVSKNMCKYGFLNEISP